MSTVIAIDLGGTKVSAALVDGEGQMLQTLTQPTANSGREAILAQLISIVEQLRTDHQVQAIGLGTPGLVDTAHGVVLLATNLPGWSQTAVQSHLQQATGIPTVVANDADAAAIGEAWVGAGQDKESFVMLTLGTGVGGAIYHRRQHLWQGAHYRSAEFGHSILYPGGRRCACGQLGCVDQYISGRAIEKTYQQQTGISITGVEICRRAEAQEPVALSIIAEFAHDLATHLISLQSIIDPETFIIGGGLLQAQPVWGGLLTRQLRLQQMPDAHIEWVPAITGAAAGLLGAGKLAWEQVGRE